MPGTGLIRTNKTMPYVCMCLYVYIYIYIFFFVFVIVIIYPYILVEILKATAPKAMPLLLIFPCVFCVVGPASHSVGCLAWVLGVGC